VGHPEFVAEAVPFVQKPFSHKPLGEKATENRSANSM
jgi:hypothetical protein